LEIARFEHEPESEPAADAGQRLGGAQRLLDRLDDARSGDDEQWCIAPDTRRHTAAGADQEVPRHAPAPADGRAASAAWRRALLPAPASASFAAATKPLKSGCGCSGRLLSSGWNCTARKKGCAGISTI